MTYDVHAKYPMPDNLDPRRILIVSPPIYHRKRSGFLPHALPEPIRLQIWFEIEALGSQLANYLPNRSRHRVSNLEVPYLVEQRQVILFL